MTATDVVEPPHVRRLPTDPKHGIRVDADPAAAPARHGHGRCDVWIGPPETGCFCPDPGLPVVVLCARGHTEAARVCPPHADELRRRRLPNNHCGDLVVAVVGEA